MFKLKYWCKLWPTDTCNVNKFLHKDKFINLLGTSRWYYTEIQILFNQPFTQIICAYSTSGSNVITRDMARQLVTLLLFLKGQMLVNETMKNLI